MVAIQILKPNRDDCQAVLKDALRLGFNYNGVGSTIKGESASLDLASGHDWVVDQLRVQVGRGQCDYEAAKSLLRRWQHFQLGWAEVDADTPVEEGGPVCVVAKTLFLWTANPLKIVYVMEEGGGRGQRTTGTTPEACDKLQRQRKACPWQLWGPGRRQQHQQQQEHQHQQHLDRGRHRILPLCRWHGRTQQPTAIKSQCEQRDASSGSSGRAEKLGRKRFAFAHGCLRGHMLAGEESFAVEWDQADDTVWFDIFTFSRPVHPLAVVTYPLVRFYQRKFATDSAAAMQLVLSRTGNL